MLVFNTRWPGVFCKPLSSSFWNKESWVDVRKEAEARFFLEEAEKNEDDFFLGGGKKSEDYLEDRFDPYHYDEFGYPDTGEPHFMSQDYEDEFEDDHFSAQLSRFSLTDFFENLLNLSRS